MDYTTHVTLLARLAEGVDPAAWKEFHDRYADLIRSFALRYGFQPADSDDVTQSVLLSLTRSLGKFRYDPAKGKFRSYLKTLALHEIFRIIRQKDSQGKLDPLEAEAADSGRLAATDDVVDEQWEMEWRRYHVRRAMRRLEPEYNERDRMAFSRYAINGHSAAETAAALGMSVDQVYQAKSRILKRLTVLIGEQINDEG